jgi:uncharacterized protein YndB with AHSA1/START domain
MRIIRLIPIFFGAVFHVTAVAQSFPGFLEGTWKVANGNSYEHWDLVSEKSLRGFMFRMDMGMPVVSEYLEINQQGEDIIYRATVLDQNQGESIPFTLSAKDSIFSFENPAHDFPTIIRYKPLTMDRISVFVGTETEGFEFEMMKPVPEQENLLRTVQSTIDTLPSGELMLKQEIVIQAPLEAAWSAYTSPEAWKKWVTPVVDIDFRINGTIRSHYNPGATIGDDGTITIHILNYIPEKQITMQAEIGEGFPEFIRENAENLYSIVEFDQVSDHSTRVRLYGMGYGTDPQWQEFMQFFIQGNELSLNNLKDFLEAGL